MIADEGQGRVGPFELPHGWRWSTIGAEYRVNERNPHLRELPDDLPVSFVPMAAVDAERGVLASPETKVLGEVRKGFTPFGNDDVIFARITPSMENGKAAIARDLKNGFGFGSTEFHVMHPSNGNLPEWIFHFIRQQTFRNEAKSNFTGTAGQLRVPDRFIRNAPIPIAPPSEQRRIVAKIESLLEETRTARFALERTEPILKKFRQALLSAAFRGRLAERDGNDEPASILLGRIEAERRKKWEENLNAKSKNAAKAKYPEAVRADSRALGELPDGWVWTSLGEISWDAGYGTSEKCDYTISSYPVLRIPNIARGEFDLTDLKYAKNKSKLNQNDALSQGDLIIVRTNGSKDLIGRGAVAQKSFAQALYYASYLIRFRIVAMPTLLNWVATIWNSPSIRSYLEQSVSTTAGQYNVNIAKLSSVPIPLPPLAEQQRIVKSVALLFLQVQEVERSVEVTLHRTDKMEQAILARAFRGEL